MLSDTHKLKRLAQPVKDACKALYGWCDLAIESENKEVRDDRYGISPRLAMVHLTQSLRSFVGADFFTRRFFDDWDKVTPIVIPDVRFADDVREIHKRGGITIRITRENAPDHEFEHCVDSLITTHTVSNDGTIDELRQKIIALNLCTPSTSSD